MFASKINIKNLIKSKEHCCKKNFNFSLLKLEKFLPRHEQRSIEQQRGLE